MNTIEEEADELQARFAEQKTAIARAKAERLAARRIQIRDDLREGKVIEQHFKTCRTCILAILNLDHGSACYTGRQSLAETIEPGT
jgi:multidrug resistance efflux pump